MSHKGTPHMALKYTSTVVFVGSEFPITVFNERTLFSGDLDPDQLKIGRIARYSYSSGTYQFTIHPERIDLECTGPVIVPDEVVDAAEPSPTPSSQSGKSFAFQASE